MTAVDLTDELVEVVRRIDEAAGRWAGDKDRAAVSEGIAAVDEAGVLLPRVRDALTREARAYDQDTRPYDGRD